MPILTPRRAALAALLMSSLPAVAGDAGNGAALIAATGCGTCHSIPGIAGAGGRVGPPLGGVAARRYIAGMLPNTPDNLAAWVRFPQRFAPGNVMPDMGLTDDEARDIAAYLLTLR